MRNNLPKVGIPYRSVDGSASLEDVANHFQVSPIAIATASLPSEDANAPLWNCGQRTSGKENISPRGTWVCSVFTSRSLADKGSSKKSCSKGILELSRLPGIKRIFALSSSFFLAFFLLFYGTTFLDDPIS